MDAVSHHLGDSFHRLGRGVFEPTRLVPEFSWQPFSKGAGLYPQYECTVMSLGVTLGKRWKGRANSALVALDLSGPSSWKTQCQDVVPPGF